MKGVFNMNIKIKLTDDLSRVTKRVVRDFNMLTEAEFFRKYMVSKTTYLKRFIKYGDPYMNAPLAKFGKFLKKHKMF